MFEQTHCIGVYDIVKYLHINFTEGNEILGRIIVSFPVSDFAVLCKT